MKYEEIRKLKKNTNITYSESRPQKNNFKFDLRVMKNMETEAPYVTVL